MNLIRSILSELVGLFVDDGRLALQATVLVGAVALLVKAAGLPPLAGAVALIAGCLAILGLSLWRKTRD